MKKTKANIVIIALMLVAFLGQAFASADVSCIHKMPMELSMMNHDNMSDTMGDASSMLESSEQGNIMDCCQEQCKCPMSGCLSLYILSSTRFNAGVIAEQKIAQLPAIHQSQVSTSLYRPPIS